MPNYTATAFGTVLVVVGGAEATRLARLKQNTDHPSWKQWTIGSPVHPVLGGFALGVFLFAAGIANEYLASMLCLLIIAASLLINGLNIFSLLNSITAK